MKSCVNDKDADQTAHLQSDASIEGADLHAYHTAGASNRGTDQSTHSHSLKGMTDADQPAHP